MKNLLLIVIAIILFLYVIGSGNTPQTSLKNTPQTFEEKLDRTHQQYHQRTQGIRSSYIESGSATVTRGDVYKECMDRRYYRNEDPQDFCSWHANMGKYQ